MSKLIVLHIWTCLQSLMKIQQWLFKILRKQNVTDGRTDGRTHGQRENSIPTTNKVCGGYNKKPFRTTKGNNSNRIGPWPLLFMSKLIVLHIWTCLQSLMKIQQWLFKILRKQNVTDGRTDGRTHGQRENSIPTTNKVCGGYNKWYFKGFKRHYYGVKG